MNKMCLILLIISILISNRLEGQSCAQQMNDAVWKKDVMLALSKRYIGYNESGGKSKIELDLYWKFNDLNRFPFGTGMHKLKEELTSKKIVFDSIICKIEQNTYASNIDYLYPAFYYVFKDGRFFKLYLFNAYDTSISEFDWTKQDEEYFIEDWSKTDNIFKSLLVFTKIYPDWRFEISKIIINSH